MAIQDMLNQVFCMDSVELIKALPDNSVDLFCVDPPYGLAGRVFDFPHKHYTAVNESWDMFAPTSWMTESERVLKPTGSVVCFCVRKSTYIFASEALRLGWRIINDITWVKPDAPPNFTGRMLTETTERALWFSPSGNNWTYNLDKAKEMNGGINLRDVWRFNTERENREHPTQKPLKLMERCIQLFSNENDLIVDCFCGSGTTCLAARNLGRQFIGNDITPEYVAIARKRLAMPFTPMFPQLLQADTLPPETVEA